MLIRKVRHIVTQKDGKWILMGIKSTSLHGNWFVHAGNREKTKVKKSTVFCFDPNSRTKKI